MGTSTGKIGRLDERAREIINRLILDNAPAEVVIAEAARQGADDVTPQNVSTWKKHGFAKWLKRVERIERMSATQEFARQVVSESRANGDDGLSLAGDVASAMAVDTITQVLEDFETDTLKALLADKPDKFIDLVHALSNVRGKDQAREKLNLQLQAARKAAADAAKLAAQSGNTDLAKVAEEMRRILGA